ncbi:MAG: isoleucine--tRNA ligase [Elusimicrobiaceae bacterium]|jgi:isoleucyl-tRNA synthetase|nr:isoleucine--tRNA ligase [Elusimicrobiaceae bacterium]MBT4439700.1 isoleucine--tRNA ligase [Elusimicrobiaceae bacterium]MBT5987130.1 isoleucine--tRNA ligase [Elusimicrobiaceae bacterium]MBT6715936.1 isoleucine--tRNA ligase [Elusimicrobiaceae bacterium]
MSKENKYSKTVLLPKTDFPMRAGLSKKEPGIIDFWNKLDLYNKMLEKNKSNKPFILHDGPPYANGHTHIGHSLNKILKDMVVKFVSMNGHYSPFVPGWDCHGLPIEQTLMKELKTDKKHITDIVDFRKKARVFAEKFVDIQREEFKRLGIQAEWDNPYLTMSNDYEGTIISSFLDLLDKEYIYKGKKSIYWCPSCETALADAETEYKDKNSTSIFIAFDLKEEVKGKKASIVIWTTTPWTIPANMASAVADDEDYVLLKTKEKTLIVADKLADEFIKDCKLSCDKIGKIAGKKLVGLKYIHPLNKEERKVITTDFVAMDSGTGIVHIAPGHGEDDFYAGIKNNLDIFCPVNEKGVFTKEAGEFAGQHIFKANPKVVERLEELGNLLGSGEISHSYPHCWRCKKPVIFRATEQWFLGVDTKDLRKKTLAEIKKVKWVPAFSESRITSMVEVRPDWCLSRQRFWGSPIPVIYCKECDAVQKDKKLFDSIKAKAMANGTDFWFEESVEQLTGKNLKCKCGSKNFRKETDILDVWFDSGVSWNAVLKQRGIKYPASLYLEGSDQHRGWFQTSLIPSMALHNKAPYEKVLTHGFVLDHNGKAMHKSLGNVVSPHDVINKYGADILRLWVSLADYTEDIRLSEEILGTAIDTYRKLRNTIRYGLGNLFDYNPKKHKISSDNLTEMDKYMLNKLDTLITDVKKSYDGYQFRKAVRQITDFCILDLSSFLLDSSKDRLYTLGTDAPERRSAQTVLDEIVKTILLLLAPVLSFTTEEAWQELKKLPCGKDLEESIFLAKIPQKASYHAGTDIEDKWDKIRAIRLKVLKALEEAREKKIIGSSSAAKVLFKTNDTETKKFLESTLPLWSEVAIISEALISDTHSDNPLEVEVLNAEGDKCDRCWRWHKDVGENKEHPDVCGRCLNVIKKEKSLT